MLMRACSALVTGLVLCFLPTTGWANDDGTAEQRAAPVARLLRNREALADWLGRRSYEVAAARAQLEQARAQARGVRLLPNPIVDFTVSNYPVGTTNPAGLGPDRTLVYSAGISELFEIGKRGPRAEAADYRAGAASKRVDATTGGRIADARLAIGRAVYARARHRSLDESLTASRAVADIAKGRLEHQALAGVDYDRLLLDLASLEADAAQMRAEAEAALASCAAVLLAPCDLSGTDIVDLDAAVDVPAVAKAAIIEKRSDVMALRLDAEAARWDATLAGRRAIPDVTARFGYVHSQFTASGDNSNTLGVTLMFPLPVFDHGQHDKALALARADELEKTARATVMGARGDLIGLVRRAQTFQQTLAGLEKDTLPRAESVLAASEKGLREGQLDMTDLLLARRQAINLRLLAIDVRFGLFNAKNELRRTLGLDDAALKSAK